jgi:hypothetical protein
MSGNNTIPSMGITKRDQISEYLKIGSENVFFFGRKKECKGKDKMNKKME